jgi:hybrid polyketide synthase/nonribosomal peptide synthetase ACE1
VSKQSVVDTYRLICRTLPPIAGVANGAMVLRDSLLADMSIDDMNTVIEPKVNGSLHLHQLFLDPSLDFFIFFSSAIGVTGNVGQSNYAISNAFMHGLAAQRRNLGLAASVIVIGVILGVGYVTRETSQALQDNLLKSGHTWMSEEDFHTLFAEAIVAGSLSSEGSSEIISGLKMVDSSNSRRPPWSFNPKFQHLVTNTTSIGDIGDQKQHGRVPLRTQLLEANSKDDALSALQGETPLSQNRIDN